MANPIIVNASTTLVQVDTSARLGSYVVLLSNLNLPGSMITVRDSMGGASMTNTITLSTISAIKFLNGGGPDRNIYTINQPFGFLTVTPKTSSIWGVVNTFAFPDASQTANLFQINVSTLNVSSFATMQALNASTCAISTVCTNNLFVQGNIVYDQSTIGNVAYYTSTIYALGDITTKANIYVASTVSTTFVNASSTIYAPFISTTNINMSGVLNTNSTISTAGPLFVGSSISTTGNLAVGASTFVQGQLLTGSLSTLANATISGGLSVMSTLYTQGSIYTQSSITAVSSISTLHNMNIGGSLSTLGNAFIAKELYITSSLFTTGSISTLQNVNVAGGISTASNLYVGGTALIAGGININNLTACTINALNYVSTVSSMAAGGSFNVGGSTILQGTVSAMSNFNIGGLLSTTSTIVGGDSLFIAKNGFFGSTVSTASMGVSSLYANMTFISSLSTFGQSAFYSSMQIQGSASIFSSLAVAYDVDVGRTLTTKNLNITGSTFISTLAVTNTVGFALNISSSTLHYGLFSTAGAMNIAGLISTTNALTVGSTIDTQYLKVQAGMSVFSNANFTQDIFALSSLYIGLSTVMIGNVTASTNMSTLGVAAFGSSVNILGSTIGTSAHFNTVIAPSIFNSSIQTSSITASTIAAINTSTNALAARSTITQTLFAPTIYNSSIQTSSIVGSTIAAINTSTNALAATSTITQTLFAPTIYNSTIQTSSITASTIAAINTSTNSLTTVSSLTQNAYATNIYNSTLQTSTITASTINTVNMSTLGTAAFYSSVQVQGSLSVFSTLTAYTINFTSSITSNGLPFSGGGGGTLSATSSFAQVTKLPLTANVQEAMCFDPSGNMYVQSSGVIYRITPKGITSLIAGTYGVTANVDGTGPTAIFNSINALAYDSYTGGLIVGTTGALRLVSLSGVTITIAGDANPYYTTPADGSGNVAVFGGIAGVCSDGSGAFYITEQYANTIRKVTIASPTPTAKDTSTYVLTVAGSSAGFQNGTGNAARFQNPYGIVINSTKSLLYVTDSYNNAIRSVSLPGYVVTTVAGSYPTIVAGSTDSTTPTSVLFSSPYGLAIDSDNNLMVCDYANNKLRYVSISPFYTHTLAGGTAANISGVGANGAMNGPSCVTLDSNGNPWIVSALSPAIFNYNMQTGYLNLFYQSTDLTPPTPANIQNTAVSTVIVPAMATGTLFGSGFTGFNSGVTYVSPQGLIMDSQNNLYVSDKFKVRKVGPSGFVTSIFGDPSNIQNTNQPFPGAEGEYNGSYQMCMDTSGNMYIADAGYSTIHVITLSTGAVRNITPTGQALNYCFGIVYNNGILYVSNTNILASPPAGYIVAINLSTNVSALIAGSTTVGGLVNATGTAARFRFIYGLSFDLAKQNILICDRGNTAIRQYAIGSGAVTTYTTGVAFPSFIAADTLGNYYATSGTSLYKITGGSASLFSSGFAYVLGVTVDAFNNIYVSDITNNCIYFISPDGTSSVYSGISGASGTQDSLYASTISLLTPYVGINKSNAQYTLDVAGSVNFTGALYNNGIAFSGGTSSFSTLNAYTINFTSSITSNGLPFTSGVSATSGFAQVNLPLASSRDICFDPSGNMYVADASNNVIYKISPQGVTSLLAGNYGVSGWVDGTGSAAVFTQISQLIWDSYTQTIVVATNYSIRSIHPVTGVVVTIAGSGTTGNAPGTGILAGFSTCNGVCGDGSGNFYVTDSTNCVKKVTISSSTSFANTGVMTIVVGSTATISGYTNATGTSARFSNPNGIVINSAKTLLWLADQANNVIRQITLPGYVVTTLAGALTSPPATSIDSTTATSVTFNAPVGIAIDANNNLFVTEYGGHKLRFINTGSFYTLTLAGSTVGTVAGVGANSQMNQPYGIAFDPSGSLWITTLGSPTIFNYSIKTGYLSIYFQASATRSLPDNLQNTAISTIIVPAMAATTLFGSGFTALNSVVTYLSPQGLVMDSQNNLYVSDKFKLRKVAPSGFVTSIFGDPSNTQDGNQPVPGSKGQFNGSYQMCLDNSGNMYIADSGVSTVHVVNLATGAVTNLAPTGQAIGNCFGVLFNAGILYVSNTNMTASPPAGYIVAVNLATNVGTLLAGSTTLGALTNANGTSARFNFIYGMCFDVAKANILICDSGNGVIRQYNIATTAVTTYSSTVASFIASDSLGNYYATGGTSLFKIVAGTATTFSSGFSFVLGVTVDSFNNIYVSDILNNCIYFINPAGVASVYSGIAGITGTQDSIYGSTISLLTPYVGINKANAQYNLDVGGSINFSGGLYSNGSLFFAATPPNMTLSTLSTVGQAAFYSSVQIQGGLSVFSSIAATNLNFTGGLYSNGVLFTGGSGSPTFSTISTIGQASFNSNVQIRGSLSVFSSLSAFNMNTNGMNVNTLTANTGFAQITGLTLPSSRGICFDPSGNMYVNSSYLYTIYKITPQGQTSLLAGSYGLAGTTDGIGSAALFANSPQQMWYDSYTGCIAMATNSALRLISLTGVVTTIASGFSAHYGVCSDGAGNFYITDNNSVKRVTISSPTPAANSGTVTTIAGGAASYINGDGATARFNSPYHIVINSSKTALYVADYANNVIRQVNVASPFTVTTLAGAAPTGGPPAASGTADSTTATSVSFTSPVSMAIDANNNIFVGDYGNNRIRYINVSPFYTLTIGGDGTTGALSGVGTNSKIYSPHAMTIDPYGGLWVVSYDNGSMYTYNSKTGYFNLLFQNTNAVPKPVNVQIPATSTIVAPAIATATLYGSGYTITNSNSANPGGATYQSPNGVLLDSQNNLYVCDNRRIRKISPSGLVTSVYGDVTNTQDTTQIGTGPEGVSNILYQSLCFDNSGNIYVSQFAGNSILRINLATGVATNLAITGQALNGPNGMLFNNNILYVINENKGGSGFTQYSSYVVAINLATNVSVIVAGSLTNTAIFNWAFSMCFDATKTNIYVSNYSNGSGNIKIIANFANTGSYPITPTTFTTSGLAGLSLLYITSDNLGNFYGSGTYTGIPVTRGIIKITSAGVASSFCNTVTLNGASVNIGVATGLAVDPYNNVYFADANRLFIGIITPGGGGSVYSGANGTSGTQDSTYASSISLMAPYVGINNPNPTAALHVNGNTTLGSYAYLSNGTKGLALAANVGLANYSYDALAGDSVIRAEGTGAGLCLVGAGGYGIRVGGVGATTISGLLNVTSWGNLSHGSGQYFNTSQNTGIQNAGAGNDDLSITASKYILSGVGFIASSDERIKKNIVPVTDSLDIVNKLNLVSFDFIDLVQYKSVKHGLIAQQVKEVYPEAVVKTKGYIPSVFNIATTYEKTDNNVTITSTVPTGFSVKDSIRLYISDDTTYENEEKYETEVLEIISDTQFVVKVWDNFVEGDKVFIYGKEVDDFLSVDKPLIGLIAAGACKVLSGQVSSLKADSSNASTITGIEFSTLQAENTELRSTIAAILEKYPL